MARPARSGTWRRGTTSTCVGAAGSMSRNARECSVSATTSAGISPGDDAAEQAVLAGGGAHAPESRRPGVGGVCHDARMTTEHPDHEHHQDTDAFRGATFRRVDLSGASFREVDLSGVTVRDSDVRGLRIVASMVDDVHLSGHEGVGRVVVDDVDVSRLRARPSSTAATRSGCSCARCARPTTCAPPGRVVDGTVGRGGRPRRHRARGAAGRAGRRRVVVRRDDAPPRLRRRHLGRADAERRAGRRSTRSGCRPPTPRMPVPPRWA